jgi:hypothetical protein
MSCRERTLFLAFGVRDFRHSKDSPADRAASFVEKALIKFNSR